MIKKAAFITNDSDIVILAANANKMVAILHSFKNIGGMPVCPMNKYDYFVGTSVNATVVSINVASITGNQNIMLGFYGRFGIFARVSELGISAFSQYICFSGKEISSEAFR